MKTFIKWSGNKTQHINKFIQYIPEFEGTYIEPFVGSGAMLLYIEPEKWIINDINKDLINIYKNVKKCPDKIIKEFKNFDRKFRNVEKNQKINLCKKITQNLSNNNVYDYKRASNYILMKYCSFTGEIIIKNEYTFEGLSRNIYINNIYSFLSDKFYRNLLQVSEFLNETKGKIYNKDYTTILEKAKEGDFVFLDPPYIEDHDYQFNYNKDEILNIDFINNLYQQVKNLDEHGVLWLMTQADTNVIKNTFKDYTIKKMKVYRVAQKKYVNELIIFNYDI